MRPREATYIRMCTEHQWYSTANQRDAPAQYAEERGLNIVPTYADGGRSGLHALCRAALCTPLADFAEGWADFSIILVYDVRRWGRFQDCEESACYEFLLRRAGILLPRAVLWDEL